jgi:hypothetical protein
MLIGAEVEQYGKKWMIVGILRSGFYLAVEQGSELPSPVQVIYYSFKKEES